MDSIWKWEIPITDEFGLDLPAGSSLIINVDMQHGVPWYGVWHLFEADDLLEEEEGR